LWKKITILKKRSSSTWPKNTLEKSSIRTNILIYHDSPYNKIFPATFGYIEFPCVRIYHDPLQLSIPAIFGYIEFPCVRISPLQLFIVATFGYYIDNEILVWLDWIPSNIPSNYVTISHHWAIVNFN
jgi:hypothetical protein